MRDIERELRVFFPTGEFQLTSRQEETRTYIAINYTDGVSKSRIKNLARQFTHSYPSAGQSIRIYIEVNRDMSKVLQTRLLSEMKSVWKIKGTLSLDDYFAPIESTVKNYLQKIFDMRDFD